MSDYKPELIGLVKELALEVKPEGEFFTLKSGAQSAYYLDCRNLTLTPHGLCVVTRSLWFEMQEQPHAFMAFGGPSIGADPIVGALVSLCGLMPSCKRMRGFLVRPTAKAHGKAGRIVGPLKPGDNCILIEDVVFTGQSSMDAIDEIEAFGAKVVHAFCIVDRLQGGAQKFADRGIPFKPLLDVTELGLPV